LKIKREKKRSFGLNPAFFNLQLLNTYLDEKSVKLKASLISITTGNLIVSRSVVIHIV